MAVLAVLVDPSGRFRCERTQHGWQVYDHGTPATRRGALVLEHASLDRMTRWLLDHGADPTTLRPS